MNRLAPRRVEPVITYAYLECVRPPSAPRPHRVARVSDLYAQRRAPARAHGGWRVPNRYLRAERALRQCFARTSGLARDVDDVGRLLRNDAAAHAYVSGRDDGRAFGRLDAFVRSREGRERDATERRLPVSLYVAGDAVRVGEVDGPRRERERFGQNLARVTRVEDV